MGKNLLDQYSLLHFAQGVIAFFWGTPAWLFFAGHVAFELVENTEAGMKAINDYIPFWPGGKNAPDTWLNIVGDNLSAAAGYWTAWALHRAVRTSGRALFDPFTLMHAAAGVMAYFWGVDAALWFGVHGAWELFESSRAGLGAVNALWTWPGRKGPMQADGVLGIVGDTVAGMAGFWAAKALDETGVKKGWYAKSGVPPDLSGHPTL